MPPPYVTAPDPDEFVPHMNALEETSAAAAEATLLTGQRKWMYPSLNGWSGDPQDISGMNNAFDRTNLNNTYIQILNDQNEQGFIGEAMAVKIQIDYIAALERSFRTRHCSSVRAKIHAAARRQGQGNHNFGLFNVNIQTWLLRLIEAAHDSSGALE